MTSATLSDVHNSKHHGLNLIEPVSSSELCYLWTFPIADDVEATGIVTRRWGRDYPGARCDVEIMLLGNNVSVLNKRNSSAEITDELTRSFKAFWAENMSWPLTARNRIVKR